MVHKALRRCLHLKKRPARWTPHELSDQQRARRVDICRQLLRLRANRRDLLETIVTRDESWILAYDPSSRQVTCEWLFRGQKRTNKPRSGLRTQRLMLVVFFDIRGIVHREFTPRGLGVRGHLYLDILRHLRRAMRRRRPQMWMTGRWWLQHDGAPAHRANIVTRYLRATQTCVLPHPAYSPDVTPCDYWLFARIKRHLKGQRFQDINELRRTVNNVMRDIPREQFEYAINKLVPRWRACVAAQGNYFE